MYMDLKPDEEIFIELAWREYTHLMEKIDEMEEYLEHMHGKMPEPGYVDVLA